MIALKKSFIYTLLATVSLAIMFFCYIAGDGVVEAMDGVGWLFFGMSCLSHALLLLLALFVVFYLPFALMGLRRLAAGLLVGSVGVLHMLAFVNMQVYKIYRFHLNGFVLNMLTGPSANEIFDFDVKLYLTESVLLLGIVALCLALWPVAGLLARRSGKKSVAVAAMAMGASVLLANGIHAWGAFVQRPSVMLCARLVPYYFPLTANSLLRSMGIQQSSALLAGDMNGKGDICYPLHPLEVADTAARPNIVLILIDSWSRRALTQECMPRLWQLAHEEQWYQNHVSCSNGTRYAVFGLFTSLQPYYYTAFEGNHLSPLLIDQLLQEGYDIKVYPSASLRNPPFHRLLFSHVPGLRTDTEGNSSYERDQKIKADLMADLPRLKNSGKPFFTFIFFDLLHAYSLPKDLLGRFQPSWEYGDFARLNNDMDPTPFWNLYRNSAYQTDLMIGQIIDEMKRLGMYDNSLVLITGDHSQEYNENHKNYWGHNSNFSQYQIGVPFIVHRPDTAARPAVFTHRTTHYDVVPTLMHDYLGVANPVDDYSAGRLLNDTTPRLWHFVGNELRYAFLVEGDTIITKEGNGWIGVTDAQMNMVNNYHIKPRDFHQAVQSLNRFFSDKR